MKHVGTYDWAVLGANLQGMAAVAKLLDMGENQHSICWIDETFAATPVKLDKALAQFLYSSPSFRYCDCDHLEINHAMGWMIEQLAASVRAMHGKVSGIEPSDNGWRVGNLNAHRVVIGGGNQSGQLAPGVLGVGSDLTLKRVIKVLNKSLPALSRL